MDIEAFIDASNNTNDLKTLKQLMTNAIGHFGYSRIVCFSDYGPDGDEGDAPHDRQFITTYNERNLKATDPVLHLFFTHNLPFTHKQIHFNTLAPEQQEIMKLHQGLDMLAGYNIPLGSLCTHWVGLTLSGKEATARDDEVARHQLYAITHQYILRYAQVSKNLPHEPAHMAAIVTPE